MGLCSSDDEVDKFDPIFKSSLEETKKQLDDIQNAMGSMMQDPEAYVKEQVERSNQANQKALGNIFECFDKNQVTRSTAPSLIVRVGWKAQQGGESTSHYQICPGSEEVGTQDR